MFAKKENIYLFDISFVIKNVLQSPVENVQSENKMKMVIVVICSSSNIYRYVCLEVYDKIIIISSKSTFPF